MQLTSIAGTTIISTGTWIILWISSQSVLNRAISNPSTATIRSQSMIITSIAALQNHEQHISNHWSWDRSLCTIAILGCLLELTPALPPNKSQRPVLNQAQINIVETKWLSLILCAIIIQIWNTDHMNELYLLSEILTLTSISLIGPSSRNNAYSTESIAKYYLLNSVASIILIWAILIRIRSTGIISLSETALQLIENQQDLKPIQLLNNQSQALNEATTWTFISFKLSLWPFLLYMPEIYESQHYTIITMLAISAKASQLELGWKLWSAGLSSSMHGNIYALWGLSTILWTTSIANHEHSTKRLIGLSSSIQTGFMLYSLGAIDQGSTGTYHQYSIIYSLMNYIWILSLASRNRRYISEAMSEQNLGTLLIGSISILNLISLPPTAGFTIKIQLISIALISYQSWVILSATLSKALSMNYYLQMIANTWTHQQQYSDTIQSNQWDKDSINITARTSAICTSWIALYLLTWHSIPESSAIQPVLINTE